MSSAELKKKPRGSFDHRSDGTVYVAKWNDNAIVGMASNCLTYEPIQNATRRVKGASNTVVQQPYVVKQYNDFMGGVDLFDRLLSSYRPMIRGKNGGGYYFRMSSMLQLLLPGAYIARSLAPKHCHTWSFVVRSHLL